MKKALFLLASGLIAAVAVADPSGIECSVLKITSADQKVCGTGFLLNDGKLATNMHVIADVCKKPDCSDMKIFTSCGLGNKKFQELAFKSAQHVFESAALDTAVLKMEWERSNLSGVFSFDKTLPAVPGQTVEIAGYPRCGLLTVESGTVENITSVDFLETAKSSHGSSGSPVYLSDYTLTGIFKESASISGALGSAFLGSSFNGRASRADIIHQALNSSLSELSREADLLTTWYRKDIMRLSGASRLREGSAFSGAAQRFRGLARNRASTSPSSAWPFLYFGSYIDYLSADLPALSQSEFDEVSKILEAVTAYNLEINGAKSSVFFPAPDFKPGDRAKTIGDIESVSRLVRESKDSLFVGLQMLTLGMTLIGAAVFSVVFFLWAFSLGLVWKSVSGGFIKRTVKTAAAAVILWPLSLFFALRRS